MVLPGGNEGHGSSWADEGCCRNGRWDSQVEVQLLGNERLSPTTVTNALVLSRMHTKWRMLAHRVALNCKMHTIFKAEANKIKLFPGVLSIL